MEQSGMNHLGNIGGNNKVFYLQQTQSNSNTVVLVKASINML